MNRTDAQRLLTEVTKAWVADDSTAAVWTGAHEGRWGLRLEQRTRDATTIWFDVGDLTISYEAYLLPRPPGGQTEVYRQCLVRNLRSWPATIALDAAGDIYVVGKTPIAHLAATDIDLAVGAIYDLVDASFRALLEAGFESREK